GGSTEFVVGKGGNVVFARSLNLGHVSLSQRGFGQSEMREYVRSVMEESGLVEDVKGFGFEVVVGSSGTIQALEKAVFDGYGDNVGNNVFGVGKRDWRLSRGELRAVVERLCGEGEEESERRERFFKRRSEFIVAGAVLLEEIFEALGVEEMEVSGFALAEGVVAEILSKACESCDLNANARWRSVVRLATRFDGKKRMVAAAQCAAISKVCSGFGS
ncbi:uncharacterized protein LOC112094890, partial [Morus notabilis]|uniref:uncharacterized protein LOC112094890 n=1 Tax=Morus notabilis TaxID=981085 RepID=UPI000CED78A4